MYAFGCGIVFHLLGGVEIRKLHANFVSASEAGGEFFQVLFEENQSENEDEYVSTDKYFLIQRQFEFPDNGECYIETQEPSECEQCQISFSKLNRDKFCIQLPEQPRKWEITFAIDDDNYEEVKRILKIILCAPNHLVLGDIR